MWLHESPESPLLQRNPGQMSAIFAPDEEASTKAELTGS